MEKVLPDHESADAEFAVQSLRVLTPAASAFLQEKQADTFSFASLLPMDYFNIIGTRLCRELDVDDVRQYVGLDETAPLGSKTPCAVEMSNLICDSVRDAYPDDEHIQMLLREWHEIDEARSARGFAGKNPHEIEEMQSVLDALVRSWGTDEIRRMQCIFTGIREKMDFASTEIIPRAITRIYMREEDGHRKGEIQMKNESPIKNGCFVAVAVNQKSCFRRVVFSLGLEPGYHVLASCGSMDNHESHLYALRCIRMMPLRNDARRRKNDRTEYKKLVPLYAQTYFQAQKIKELNTPQEAAPGILVTTLTDLWCGNVRRAKPAEPEIWVTGAELKKELGQPDPEFRHTVRGLAIRRRASEAGGFQWEVLTVTERGDNAAERIGKPPGIGLPGGMREKDATLEQTLCRETENEAQTKRVTKVVALVALQKKHRRSDAEQENIDHWFYIETDLEAGLSKKMVEGDEIFSVQWVALSELAHFGFQHTSQKGQTVWDVKKVHERRLMYPNHADKLISILPRIPGIEIPENFAQFKDNLDKFLNG